MSDPREGEHIITREMLIATLSEVMKELDFARRNTAQVSEDYSKTLTANAKLRESNDRFQARIEELAARAERAEKELVDRRHAADLEFTRMQQELHVARKQACSCEFGPLNDTAKTIREQHEEIESLKRDNTLLTVTVRMQGERIGGLIAESAKLTPPFPLHSLDQSPEQRITQLCKRLSEQATEITALRKAQEVHDKERRELERSQCQCVPVLEEKIEKLRQIVRTFASADLWSDNKWLAEKNSMVVSARKATEL